MQTVLIVFIENILPILLIILTGFFLERKFTLDITTLTKISFYALIPVFLFVSVYTSKVDASMLLVILFIILLMIVSLILSKAGGFFSQYDADEQGVITNSALFYNCANMGLPLVYLTFADTPYLNQALTIQLAVILLQSISLQSLGLFIAKNSSVHVSGLSALASTVRMPTIFGAVLGFLFKMVPTDLTGLFFWPSIDYLYQMVIGMILITFGIQLGKTSWHIDIRKTAFPVVLRLIIGPAAALVLLQLFNFDSVTSRVLLIASSMPSAVNIALIATEENSAPKLASQIVLATTIGSIATLSIIISLSAVLFPL
jgi:predicted permease